jgi:dipeptidyl-peptidase-4
VRAAAKNLHGHLLLLHGTTDDNVHPQNTLQFARDLQQEGKLFEMMLYPRTVHTPRDKTVYHIQKTTMDFLRRWLLDRGGA